MDYVEIDKVINTELGKLDSLRKVFSKSNLQKKIDTGREMDLIRKYIHFIRLNFYLIADGSVLLTDFEKNKTKSVKEIENDNSLTNELISKLEK